MARERFRRVKEPIGGVKLRNRDASTADFLARLWTRFGEPDPSEGGFAYGVRDTVSGADFVAYSGASGPAYRGERDARTRAALDDFDRWLDATPLADCRFADGDGRVEWGAAGGVPFERVLPERGDLKAALDDAEALDLDAADRERVFDALWKLRDARDRNPAAARKQAARLGRVGLALWSALLEHFERDVAAAQRHGDVPLLARLYDGDWWQIEQGADVGVPRSFEPRLRALEQIGNAVPRRIQMPLATNFPFLRPRGTSRRRR